VLSYCIFLCDIIKINSKHIMKQKKLFNFLKLTIAVMKWEYFNFHNIKSNRKTNRVMLRLSRLLQSSLLHNSTPLHYYPIFAIACFSTRGYGDDPAQHRGEPPENAAGTAPLSKRQQLRRLPVDTGTMEYIDKFVNC
jgi:hypothetical protein